MPLICSLVLIYQPAATHTPSDISNSVIWGLVLRALALEGSEDVSIRPVHGRSITGFRIGTRSPLINALTTGCRLHDDLYFISLIPICSASLFFLVFLRLAPLLFCSPSDFRRSLNHAVSRWSVKRCFTPFDESIRIFEISVGTVFRWMEMLKGFMFVGRLMRFACSDFDSYDVPRVCRFLSACWVNICFLPLLISEFLAVCKLCLLEKFRRN